MVVRTLAKVAARIPIKPVAEESNAPAKNASAAYIPRPYHNNPATISATIEIILYSSSKKVIAPSEIAFEIFSATSLSTLILTIL